MLSIRLGRLCAGCLTMTRPLNKQYKRTLTLTSVRWRTRWLSEYYRQLYERREKVGPDPERHRSVWSNWNYNSELYAFGQRLGENFNDATLRQAFTHQSHVEDDLAKRAELGMDTGNEDTSQLHNEALAHDGYELASEYITSFLQTSYPHFPMDGIRHLHDYLLCDDITTFIACHIGIKDLMLCTDFPPKSETLTKTLFAIIGALLQDQGRERAELFVRDLIIPQLIGKDINELWPIVNPMGMLVDILKAQNRPDPEPRLTRHTGDETVMAVYFVGLYCDKQLIGEAPGETIPIAEEMAARDALKRIFGTEDSRISLMFRTDNLGFQSQYKIDELCENEAT